MNIVTEYASRPEIALQLFKTPCSLIGVDNDLSAKIVTFTSIYDKPDEISVKIYIPSSGEPLLVKETNLFKKYLFRPQGIDNCHILPYVQEIYPAAYQVLNDPPESYEQENDVKKYFDNIHNNSIHQEYRRMIVWYGFVKHNVNKEIKKVNGKIFGNNCYVPIAVVKSQDKKAYKIWELWCEKLMLTVHNNGWASEILFAKCFKRMNSSDSLKLSVPISDDTEIGM